jgi:uncharacterized protein (DUF1330 family)
MIHAVFQMTLTNPDALARYRERAGAALARHGGAVVTATPTPTTLEGDRALPDVMALLSFEEKTGALA